MAFGLIKSMLGIGAKPEPVKEPARSAPGPFGLSLGRAVTFDTMAFRLAEKDLGNGAPADRIIATGHGVVDLGEGNSLHRFYDDNSNILQVVCNGGPDVVGEVMIMKPWDSVVPSTAAEWRSWEAPGGKMGAATYDADGIVFQRVQGDPSTPWVPPIEFVEDVTVDEGPRKAVHQKTVTYRRHVAAHGIDEILAIIVEQPPDSRNVPTGDRAISFMLGYAVSPADVRPV